MDMQCNLADDLTAVKNYLELISWEVDLVGVDVVGGHHFESMCEICYFCTMQKFPTKPKVKLHSINACISYMPSN